MNRKRSQNRPCSTPDRCRYIMINVSFNSLGRGRRVQFDFTRMHSWKRAARALIIEVGSNTSWTDTVRFTAGEDTTKTIFFLLAQRSVMMFVQRLLLVGVQHKAFLLEKSEAARISKFRRWLRTSEANVIAFKYKNDVSIFKKSWAGHHYAYGVWVAKRKRSRLC